jgi:hypothetical protein
VIKTSPGPGGPYPVFLANISLGGAALNAYTPGVAGAFGVNNIGLLIKTFGKFTYIDTQTFTIDDGSGVNVKCVVADGVTIDPNWNYVAVTGISSCETVGSELHRLIRVRKQDDIVPLQ